MIDKNGDGILQYVLVGGPKSDIIANQRTQGVISTIENSGIKAEKLQSVVTNWTREVAKSGVENIFLKYDDKIEAIIANDDDLAIGSIEALQKYGYNIGNSSKFIPVFGVNGTPEAKELIDKGIMSGTVIEDLKELAETFYTVGLNLINNVNPIENTNSILENGEIISLQNPEKYIKRVEAK
ncbi:substrate-binding domain-containing protein [Clostridium sp. BL-8]|uniref:substrate-binding domain-containing protein n=1 Tax=Clostridium sp. BL-8 TaxID=349938 RepID=UPI00325A58DB